MPGGPAKTLSPGTYCNEIFSGEIALDPGVYILRGGQIKLGGNGSLTGEGVTLFLMEGAEFTVNANQVVKLSPPEDGDYAGITIYQERGNSETLTLNGGADSLVSGVVYAPDAHIFYAGNSTTTTDGCLRMVGGTIEMAGNSGVNFDCGGLAAEPPMYAGRYMTLVK